MSESELTAKQLENLMMENLPSIEKQKAMVEEIEALIGNGVDPEAALQSVFGELNSRKC
ncbi:hypothetical protein ACU6U9_10025 [Pseudomonas sp. HK3]